MKLIRRILVGAVAVVAVFVGLLAGSVIADRLLGGGRLAAVTNTQIPSSVGPEIRAYVVGPAGPGPHPAVIMIHEFYGLNADIRDKADLLAREGFVVVAPDMFRGTTTSWIPSAIYQVVSTPPEQITADVDEVYKWLVAHPVLLHLPAVQPAAAGAGGHRGALRPGDGRCGGAPGDLGPGAGHLRRGRSVHPAGRGARL